jgi:hypothetical protein
MLRNYCGSPARDQAHLARRTSEIGHKADLSPITRSFSCLDNSGYGAEHVLCVKALRGVERLEPARKIGLEILDILQADVKP